MQNSEKITEPYGFLKTLHFPRKVLADKILTKAEHNILTAMLAYSDQYGYIKYFSASKLAEDLGLHRQTISKHSCNIVRKGVLTKIETPKGFRNHYKINYEYDKDQPATVLGCQGASTEVAGVATPSSCTKKEIENREIKKDKTTLSRNEFLDEVCFLLNQGELDEYIHYGEPTIKEQAKLCYDHHMARADILPSNNIASIIRNWLHKAIAVNAIVKPNPKHKNKKDQNSYSEMTYSDEPIETWRQTILKELGQTVYNSWFKKTIADTIDKKLIAPTPAVANYISQKYEHVIRRVLPDYTIVYAA
jgi:hypothetical protein